MRQEIVKIIEKIGGIIASIAVTKISNLTGDDLSRKALSLATYKAYLGSELAEMEYKLNMMEANRKATWADAYSDLRKSEEKTTQKDCETMADNAVRSMILEEIELKKSLTKIKMLRQDIGDLATIIQTRIGVLKSERIESNYN